MNTIKQRMIRARAAGVTAASERVIPLIEAHYRARYVRALALIAFVVGSLAFASGVAVGVAWARSGIQGF